MLERFRAIFVKEEAVPELGLDELRELLAEEQRRLEGELESALQKERPEVEDAAETLRGIMARMKSREREIASHPKLEKIARSSLPSFVKAMEQQLHRTLPPDPRGYYQETTGMLKGCIAASRGAGKYLHMVLPEEMREVREEIGRLGRCVNRMTEQLKRAEARRGELAALETLLDALNRIENERAEIRDRLEKNRLREAALASEAAEIGRRSNALQRSEEWRQMEESRRALQRLTQEEVIQRQRVERFVAISLGVFRRACTISRRSKGSGGDSPLDKAVKHLQGRESSTLAGIAPLWRDAMTAARALIEEGLLVLKGAEERELFAKDGVLAQEAIATFEALEGLQHEKEAMEQAIMASPAWREGEELRMALAGVEAERKKLLQERKELEVRAGELNAKMEGVKEELAGTVKVAFGRMLVV